MKFTITQTNNYTPKNINKQLNKQHRNKRYSNKTTKKQTNKSTNNSTNRRYIKMKLQKIYIQKPNNK